MSTNAAEIIVNGSCPHDCPDACGMQTRVRVNATVRSGVVVALNGYRAAGNSAVTINWTTSDQLVDVAGQSSFQSNRVWIEKLDNESGERNHE